MGRAGNAQGREGRWGRPPPGQPLPARDGQRKALQAKALPQVPPAPGLWQPAWDPGLRTHKLLAGHL